MRAKPMCDEQEKAEIELEEARIIGSSAAQVRFTWAVIFVAFVTVLVGLLVMIEPISSTTNPLFNYTISIMYLALIVGMSYTFFAICHTSFIIDKLIEEHETKAVKDFLKEYWNPSYVSLFSIRKKKEQKTIVEFKRKTVFISSILVGILAALPLLFKLFNILI